MNNKEKIFQRFEKRMIKLGFTKQNSEYFIEKYKFLLGEFYDVIRRSK